MKVYGFGESGYPQIMLLPGTCCHWESNFSQVIPLLTPHFHVLCVSYDGFDETENTTSISMLDETEKIERYISGNFGGRIFAAYGCSLGGSFVGLLVSRGNVHIDHGILGSSDLDQGGKFAANLMSKLFMPMFYQFFHDGKIKNPLVRKMMDKKLANADEYTQKFMKMMGIGERDFSFYTKESMSNQFVSDYVTPLPDGIEADGTTVHVFCALKMGEKYRERYFRHFKNPDIVEFDMRHEELLTIPERWTEEIVKICGIS